MNYRLSSIRESLASRITLRVVLYVVVVLGISGYVGNYYVLKIVKAIQEEGILYAIGMRWMAVVLTVLFLLTMVVLTYLLRRTIHRLIAPLTTFTKAVDEVARGNLQAVLPEIHSRDEMQRLRHSFSLMQQSLAQQMEELKQVNEAKGRMEGELKVARDMQLSMLPKPYSPADDSRLDIYGSLTPAREVGGDLYDFFIRDGKLFFCIGDVSGKGVPAALVMAQTMSQFRIVASYIDDVTMITTYINKFISDGNDTMVFVTFFVGVLDLATGHLQYCNAGHNKPVFNGQFLDAKPGLPLGVEESATYTLGECDIPAGTMLFLYTDGLTEAMTDRHEQFGSQRLIDHLQSDLDCKTQIDRMTQAVHEFVGDAPQSDDLTMLAIRYVNNG